MKVYPITIALLPVSRHNEQPIDGCKSLFIQKHNMRYKHFSICIIKKKFLRMQNKHNHTIQNEAQKDKLMQNNAKQKKRQAQTTCWPDLVIKGI
jgi:hypothetical protein